MSHSHVWSLHHKNNTSKECLGIFGLFEMDNIVMVIYLIKEAQIA